MIVDVSSHNGANDWAKAKAGGVEAALIRCGYGRDFPKYDDPFFKQNIEGALANNIVVGVYLYSYAKDVAAAIEEAKHAIRLCDPYKSKIALPIFYDLEERDRAVQVKNCASDLLRPRRARPGERCFRSCGRMVRLHEESGVYGRCIC